jgi:hypothetical protein
VLPQLAATFLFDQNRLADHRHPAAPWQILALRYAWNAIAVRIAVHIHLTTLPAEERGLLIGLSKFSSAVRGVASPAAIHIDQEGRISGCEPNDAVIPRGQVLNEGMVLQ